MLQIYNIFAAASKCRENNRHSAQGIAEKQHSIVCSFGSV